MTVNTGPHVGDWSLTLPLPSHPNAANSFSALVHEPVFIPTANACATTLRMAIKMLAEHITSGACSGNAGEIIRGAFTHQVVWSALHLRRALCETPPSMHDGGEDVLIDDYIDAAIIALMLADATLTECDAATLVQRCIGEHGDPANVPEPGDRGASEVAGGGRPGSVLRLSGKMVEVPIVRVGPHASSETDVVGVEHQRVVCTNNLLNPMRTREALEIAVYALRHHTSAEAHHQRAAARVQQVLDQSGMKWAGEHDDLCESVDVWIDG